MKDICKVLNSDLESVLNDEYDSFGDIDYDGNLYWVRVYMHGVLSVYVPINNTNKKWEITYALYFGRDENCSTKIAEFTFFDGEPKKHIINQMSQMILHWISKTRIKKPKKEDICIKVAREKLRYIASGYDDTSCGEFFTINGSNCTFFIKEEIVGNTPGFGLYRCHYRGRNRILLSFRKVSINMTLDNIAEDFGNIMRNEINKSKKTENATCDLKYLDEGAAWDSKLEYDIESFIFDGYRHVIDNYCKPYFCEVGGKMFKLVQTPLFGNIILSYYDTCYKKYIPIARADGNRYDCFEINKLSKKLKEFFKDELKKAKDQN